MTMNRTPEGVRTEVVTGGAPYWYDFSDREIEQLKLANRLRNHLVAVERWADEAYKGGWTEEDQKLYQCRTGAHTGKVKPCPHGNAWNEHPYGVFTEQGLSWGTTNAVMDEAKTARKTVLRLRKQGKPCERRFKSFDGTGTITVQVQRSSQIQLLPPKSMAEWTDRTPRREKQLTKYEFTLKCMLAKDYWLEVPIRLSRLLTDNDEIKTVKISRVSYGPQFRIKVSIVVRQTKPEPCSPNGSHVSVDCYWHSVGYTSIKLGEKVQKHPIIKVAAVGSSASLSPPPVDIASWVRVVADGSADVYADPNWFAVSGRVQHIRSIRDKMRDDLKNKILSYLQEDPALRDKLELAPNSVALWRRQRNFVRLFYQWPQEHEFWTEFNAWRRRDKHLYEFECAEQNQLAARRKDFYAKVAAWLLTGVTTVDVPTWNMAELREAPDSKKDDPYVSRHARSNAQIAAPGMLREAIIRAADKRGIKVEEQ